MTTSVSSDPDSSWVAIDDFGAGVMVGEHLANLGHRDIAVLVETNQPAGSPGQRLDPTELSFVDYAARVAGLRKAIPGQVMIVSGATTQSSPVPVPSVGCLTVMSYRRRSSA